MVRINQLAPFYITASSLAIIIFENITTLHVNAFGILAHQVTGSIAQEIINNDKRYEPAKMLVESMLEHDKDFAADLLTGRATIWADQLRDKLLEAATVKYHFMPMDETIHKAPASCRYDTNSVFKNRNNIVAAISDNTAMILEKRCERTEETQRAFLFLIHLLGDLHQPLHACSRENGGNNLEVMFDGRRTNFHAIHDTEIPNKWSKEVLERLNKEGAKFITGPLPRRISSYLIRKYKRTVKSTSDALFSVDMFNDAVHPVYLNILHVDSTNQVLQSVNTMLSASTSLNCDNEFWKLYDRLSYDKRVDETGSKRGKSLDLDLGGVYYDAVKMKIEKQIAIAGFRLAGWLNEISKKCASFPQ